MIKQKIAAIAASVLAVCAIGVTAFASTVGVPKYNFGSYITEGGPAVRTSPQEKEDDKSAWVKVQYGLSSGDTFATFQVFDSGYLRATEEKDLWINGEHYIPYMPGRGIEGKAYYLKFFMEPQANADDMYISGLWAP